MCLGEVGTVVRTDEALAWVRVGDHERQASLLLHPDVQRGDEVLIHTGFVVDVLSVRGPVPPSPPFEPLPDGVGDGDRLG